MALNVKCPVFFMGTVCSTVVFKISFAE